MSLSYLILIVGLVLTTALPEDTVQLTTGFIQGLVNDQVRAFRGVPYASPPIGSLRWQKPQPIASWPGVLTTFADQAGCPQHCDFPAGAHACPVTTSEDCLYLTVYTPRLADITSPLPVMVFYHGGEFVAGHGGGSLYDGTHMANWTQTILVGVNYRLGALGWLATGSSDITGNYGFYDQLLALEWVHANAANFGGDPNRITIFGQSAGAVSVSVFLTSPLIRGRNLFQQAIIQSQPYTIPLRDKKTMPELATAFASFSNCSVSDSACLRSLTVDQILYSQYKAMTDLFAAIPHLLELFLPWTPYVDGIVLTQQPYLALIQGNYEKVPIMMGNTRDECYLFVYSAFSEPLKPFGYDVLLAGILGLNYEPLAVLAEYPLPPNTTDTRPIASQVATDLVMLCVNRNVTRAISQYSPIYMYVFDHVVSFNVSAWYPNTECYTKVCHAADLPFVFDVSKPFDTFTADEEYLSATMLTYWTNFAINGNPNARPLPISWPAYNMSSQVLMHFATPQSYLETKFLDQYCNFWDTFGYGY